MLTLELSGGSIGLSAVWLYISPMLIPTSAICILACVIKCSARPSSSIFLTLHSFRYPLYSDFQARYAVRTVRSPALQQNSDPETVDMAYDVCCPGVCRLRYRSFALHPAFETSDRVQAVRLVPVWPLL